MPEKKNSNYEVMKKTEREDGLSENSPESKEISSIDYFSLPFPLCLCVRTCVC